MTEASLRALSGLRDLTMLKWYVIPLLAIVFYIYARELKEARRSGNWDAILAGLILTGRSAFWTTPGDTALRTMVGWNIEIMFMFAIAGIIYYHTISDDPKEKILGLPNRWFWAIGYAVFCVFVEVLLNIGGLLVWEYPFWNRSFGGIWLIFVFGYFYFYAAIIFVLGLKKRSRQVLAVAAIYAVPVLMNVVARVFLGWNY